MAPIIQLGFDEQDNRLWYIDPHLWDDDTVANVNRPTEKLAFRRLFRQGRLLRKKGLYINLSNLHREAMRLEYQAMSHAPQPDNVYQWVSARMRGVTHLQVKALLQECSFVVLLRELLDMPTLDIQWYVETSGATKKGKRVA